MGSFQKESNIFFTKSAKENEFKLEFVGLEEQKGFMSVFVRIEAINESSLGILERKKHHLMFDKKSLIVITDLNQDCVANDVIYEDYINSVKLQFKFEGVKVSRIRKLIYKDNYFTNKNQIFIL